jgi:hypothetical protein
MLKEWSKQGGIVGAYARSVSRKVHDFPAEGCHCRYCLLFRMRTCATMQYVHILQLFIRLFLVIRVKRTAFRSKLQTLDAITRTTNCPFSKIGSSTWRMFAYLTAVGWKWACSRPATSARPSESLLLQSHTLVRDGLFSITCIWAVKNFSWFHFLLHKKSDDTLMFYTRSNRDRSHLALPLVHRCVCVCVRVRVRAWTGSHTKNWQQCFPSSATGQPLFFWCPYIWGGGPW